MTGKQVEERRVVLVTGGTRGIGRGIAERFLAEGAQVYVCGRKEPASLPKVEGNEAVFLAANVRDADSVDELIGAIVTASGRLDVLINNAGGAPFALADVASPRFSASIIDLNLTSAIHCSQRANRQMREQEGGGAIVNIASVSATRPSPGTAAYGAAKAGLLSFTTSVAVEWAPKVRVNAIVAGLIETEQSELHYGDAAGIARVARTIPMARMGTPADIAAACVFFASPDAGWVTGAHLEVHGGGERPAFLDAASD